MKTVYIIVLLCLVSHIGYAYEIRLELKGASQGDTCMLGHYYGSTQFVKDTMVFDSKSTLTFEGDEELEKGMYLIILNDSTYMEIMVDEDQEFSLTGIYSEFPKGISFKGSQQNKEFYAYMEALDQKRITRESVDSLIQAKKERNLSFPTETAVLDKLNNEVEQLTEKYISNHPEWLSSKLLKMNKAIPIPIEIKSDQSKTFYYYRSHFWDNVDLSDDALLFTPDFHPRLETYIQQLTVQYPDSIIVNMDLLNAKIPDKAEGIKKYFYDYIIRTYQEPKKMGTDAVFGYLIDEYLGYEKTPWVDTANYMQLKFQADHLRLNRLGMIGQDFTAVSPSGSYVTFSKIEAKFTLLFFYNYTCTHCQANTPKIKALYDKYRTQGLKVVAFNTNEELEPWLKYISENKLESIINVADVHGTTEFRPKYNVLKVPQLYLLDENKKILAKGLTPEQFDQFLSYELKK